MSGQRLKVTLVRSKQGRGRIQLACVNGLGLRRVNHSVELTDSAAIRVLKWDRVPSGSVLAEGQAPV